MMHKQEALGGPINTDRESSQRFPGRPSNFTSDTISIWSPLQPHLSGLHQVAFLQISQSSTHMVATAQWAFLLNCSSVTGLSFEMTQINTDGFMNVRVLHRTQIITQIQYNLQTQILW